MKIYTKAGDKGETAVFGGQRISKHDALPEAYGTVDEMNATLGLARAFCRDAEISSCLERMQGWLLNLGAELADPDGKGTGRTVVGDAQVAELERWIDRADEELPPLGGFILPGGDPAAAVLQQARTICRRAERRITALAGTDWPAPRPEVLRFINRLSDALYTLARLAARRAGSPELPWKQEQP